MARHRRLHARRAALRREPRWAVLLGIVTTAKRYDLGIQAYLTWMFVRRGTARYTYELDPLGLTLADPKKMLEKQRADIAA